MAGHSVSTPVLPRGFLLAALLAVAATIGAAAWHRAEREAAPPAVPAPLAAERLLRFADQPDGSIRVTDERSGAVAATIAGEAGFARGTLRSLMRERRRNGVALDLPISLEARRDGRLVLRDPATGERIDLDAFGPTNAAVFARMLEKDGGSR